MICLSRTRCCVVFVLVVQPLIRMPLARRSEEHTSELQSPCNLVCRLLLEKKKSHHVREIPRAPEAGVALAAQGQIPVAEVRACRAELSLPSSATQPPVAVDAATLRGLTFS